MKTITTSHTFVVDYEKFLFLRFSILYLMTSIQSYIAFSLAGNRYPFIVPVILAFTFFIGNLLKKNISQITTPYKSSFFALLTFVYYITTISLMFYYLSIAEHRDITIPIGALLIQIFLIIVHSFLLGSNRCVYRIFHLSALFILPITILNVTAAYISIGIFVILTPIFLIIEKINRLQEEYYEKVSIKLKHITIFLLTTFIVTILMYSAFVFFVKGKTRIIERRFLEPSVYRMMTEEKREEIISDLFKNIALILIMTIILFFIYKQLFSRDRRKLREPKSEPQIITGLDTIIKTQQQKKLLITEKNKIKRKIIFLYLDVVRALKKVGLMKSIWQTPNEFAYDVKELYEKTAENFSKLTRIVEKCSYSNYEIYQNDYNLAQNLRHQILKSIKR